jgi:predicted RNase H-like HicB family nuclease
MRYGGGNPSRRASERQSGCTGQAVMNELLFLVEEADDGSFRAQAVGEAIHTEADTLEDLRREIRDAVQCHFEEGATPSLLRLHLVRQELLAL